MPSRLGHGLYKKIDRLKNFFIYRATAMTSFSLHFRMANSNSIACFVGLPSRFFTNYYSDSINQVERHPFIQKFWKSCDCGSSMAYICTASLACHAEVNFILVSMGDDVMRSRSIVI